MVITLDQGSSLQKAKELLKKYDVRRAPLLKNGKPVGIITDKALEKGLASGQTSFKDRSNNTKINKLIQPLNGYQFCILFHVPEKNV